MNLLHKLIMFVGVLLSGVGGVSVARYQTLDQAPPIAIWATLISGIAAGGYGLKNWPTGREQVRKGGGLGDLIERFTPQPSASVTKRERSIEVPGWDDDAEDDIAAINRLAVRALLIKDPKLREEATDACIQLNGIFFTSRHAAVKGGAA